VQQLAQRIGQTFTGAAGRYVIDGVLGEGGMAIVYRAHRESDGAGVAVKMLNPGYRTLPEVGDRFARERTLLRRLDHPNVVRYIDEGKSPDSDPFVVLELLEGETLDEVLDRGALAVGRALAITRELLGALSALHAIGAVHRDIKPSNVMLARDGERETVKLLDFGIALNARAAIKLTAAGSAFGTPEYISPEMAMGQPVDARADLYGVGVMLFQMLTGKLPFVGRDPMETLKAHVSQPPPALATVAPSLREARALQPFLSRALAKERDARFASATAMADAIAAIRLPAPASRRRLGLALALVALLVLVGAAAIAVALLSSSSGGPSLPSRAAKPVSAPKKRR
jgi:serine/threonine-protein kinase